MTLSELKKFLKKEENWNLFANNLLHSYILREPTKINGVIFKVVFNDVKYAESNVEQLVFEVDGCAGNLFALDGYSNSWDGTQWGEVKDIYEVERAVIEVTVYNPV